jgi:hypothetical protein
LLHAYNILFLPIHPKLSTINLFIFAAGWGIQRFDSGRPTSLPPSQGLLQSEVSISHRMSAESSSESEASGVIKKDNKEKDKKGVFRIFSKKKSSKD